jgi:hypothetical protein
LQQLLEDFCIRIHEQDSLDDRFEYVYIPYIHYIAWPGHLQGKAYSLARTPSRKGLVIFVIFEASFSSFVTALCVFFKGKRGYTKARR